MSYKENKQLLPPQAGLYMTNNISACFVHIQTSLSWIYIYLYEIKQIAWNHSPPVDGLTCKMVCFAPPRIVISSFCSLSLFSSIIHSPSRTPGDCRNIDDAGTKAPRGPRPLLLYPLHRLSSYYSAAIHRGDELQDRLDLPVSGGGLTF